MSDHKQFLDGYGGQSLQELLAMADRYRDDSIVLAIEQALQQKAPADLSPPERVVLAVEALEREVNNGGFDQFFLNEPGHAHEIVAALTLIGCPETARITRDATSALGIDPNWTTEQIQSAAANIADEADARLAQSDGEFFAYPDPIESRLLEFIRSNAADIRLPRN